MLANDASGGAAFDPSTLTVVSAPTHASIYAVAGNGTIVYTSDPNFTGSDSLQYRVCNVSGLCSTGMATITVG